MEGTIYLTAQEVAGWIAEDCVQMGQWSEGWYDFDDDFVYPSLEQIRSELVTMLSDGITVFVNFDDQGLYWVRVA